MKTLEEKIREGTMVEIEEKYFNGYAIKNTTLFKKFYSECMKYISNLTTLDIQIGCRGTVMFEDSISNYDGLFGLCQDLSYIGGMDSVCFKNIDCNSNDNEIMEAMLEFLSVVKFYYRLNDIQLDYCIDEKYSKTFDCNVYTLNLTASLVLF